MINILIGYEMNFKWLVIIYKKKSNSKVDNEIVETRKQQNS